MLFAIIEKKMKQYIILVFALSFFSCKNFHERRNKTEKEIILNIGNINLRTDTFSIAINGDLTKAVFLDSCYYLMFESSRRNTSASYKKMIIVGKNGEFIEDVFLPSEVQDMSYYDFKIINGIMFLIETKSYDKVTLVKGDYVADFNVISPKDFRTYRDNFYDIFAVDNGEFGGTTYFQNRKTKEVFEAYSCPTIINKIDSVYYMTRSITNMEGYASIMRIANPQKLQKSTLNFNKGVGSTYNKGTEIIYKTTGLYISTSFVLKDKLLHVYTTNKGTYLGETINGKMKPLYKFEFKFYAYIDQQDENGLQVFTCYFPDTKKRAIMTIEKNNLSFHILK